MRNLLNYKFLLSSILLITILTLPFHYAFYTLKVFPKANISFRHTFISEDEVDGIIEKYNSSNQLEQTQMESEAYFRSLKEEGMIIDAKDSSKDTQSKQKAITDVSDLSVSGLNSSGDLGQVTFFQNEQTIFYYNLRSHDGKIALGGQEYVLNEFSYNPSSESYKLSGENIEIDASNCFYGQSDSDCAYGKFSLVTITFNDKVLKLEGVSMQDCPL